jgi:hypothetical protein
MLDLSDLKGENNDHVIKKIVYRLVMYRFQDSVVTKLSLHDLKIDLVAVLLSLLHLASALYYSD